MTVSAGPRLGAVRLRSCARWRSDLRPARRRSAALVPGPWRSPRSAARARAAARGARWFARDSRGPAAAPTCSRRAASCRSAPAWTSLASPVRAANSPDFVRQPLDLPLAGEDPGIDRVRAVEAHRVARELMSLAVDEHRPARQAAARVVSAGTPSIAKQPASHSATSGQAVSSASVRASASGRNAASGAPGAGRAVLGVNRLDPGRRRIVEQARERVRVGELQRVQALAEHRLDRGLPARARR